jgi:hypothetical protein
MGENTRLLICVVVYSYCSFKIGVRVFREGRYGLGLTWQANGLLAIGGFTIRALLYLGWVYGLVSGLIFAIEFAYFIHFCRKTDQEPQP